MLQTAAMFAALRRLIGRGRSASEVAPAADDTLRYASDDDRRIVERASPFSMTGAARLLAVVDAVRYCVARDITGALAECGVWRGGSILAMILTLQQLGKADRDIYLYDTFEGMTRPSEHDVSVLDESATGVWRDARRQHRRPWEQVFGRESFSEAAVRDLLSGTGYPSERLHFVRGPVEETIPSNAPGEFALLRLDTDWYESTRHELLHLFPRLRQGGVLIIDDYGHWQGARQAVDEYLSTEHPPLLLNRIDYTGRIAIKQ